MIPKAERHRDAELLDNIPEELRTRPQWLVWKIEQRDGKDTKVPYNARHAGRASSTDSMTWATFEEALDALDTGRYRGVGFVFTSGDPYAGVDLDKCRDHETGELEPWAAEIVASLDGYTEVSPSGTGLHIIVRGKAPNKKRGDIEAYSSERYFTMTGRGDSVEIPERQEPLDDLVHRHLTAPEPEQNSKAQRAASTRPPDLSDEEVLLRCRRAKNAQKFEALYDAGDTTAHDGDDSAADMALLGILKFYTQDPLQMERLFFGSRLGERPKWRTRPNYRQRTIRKALDGLTETYNAPRATGANRPEKPSKEDRSLSSPDEVNREFHQLVRGNGERPAAMPFNTTDIGNAERLVARHGENLRYVHPWGKWLEYDATRYRVDDTGGVDRRAKKTARSIYGEAEKPEYAELREKLALHAIKSETRSRIEAMVALAQSEPGIPVRPEDLDADPWLLNVQNGTLDLRTGELREHRREDLITKLAPTRYDPDAPAPAWEAFLERVLPSKGLRRFVQRAVGYSLTGDTRERILLILHGMGRNGKSTFLEAIREALGAEDGYAMKTPAETLMAKPAGGIPNDIARLKGARFVAASETERGRRLAEALVKEITGNDTISARFMRAEWFDFRPTHKVWLATNHKPEVQGTDPAIWDRIRLVPFDVRIPDDEIDRKLPEKLQAELPGILAWAVRGCLDWQREGLGEPDEVRQATEAYRSEMDTLAAFIEDRCVVHQNAEVTSKALYEAYTNWCEENGERTEKQRSFGTRLTERGFELYRGTAGAHGRRGLGLRSDREPDPPGGSDLSAGKGHLEKSPQNCTIPPAESDPSDLSDLETGMNNEKDSHEEENPELGSLGSLGSLDAGEVLDRSDMAPALASYLAAPPKDLLRQAEKCAREGGTDSRLFNPLVSSVAYEVYRTCAGGRRDEVRPAVEAWLRELQERARDA